MFLIFSEKNDIMELQKEVVKKWEGSESWGWVILLSREKSDLGFPLLAVI